MKRLLAILTFILTLTILSCGTNSTHNKNNLQFDRAKWKAGDMRTKGKMTDHILKDSLLNGKTKTEVIEMLGEPDQETISRLHYTVDLGIAYMNEPWTYWLSVDIDSVNG